MNCLPARIGASSRNHPLEGEVSVDVSSVTSLSRARSGLSPHSVAFSAVFISVRVNGWGDVDVDGLEKVRVRGVSHELEEFNIFNLLLNLFLPVQ